MEPLTPTTELEAVNAILSVIGELPLRDLTQTDGNADATMALQALRLATKIVQGRGWQFNTDLNFLLYREPDGTILVPANAVRVAKADGRWDQDAIAFTERARKLWDRANNTFVWALDIYCDITRLFDFADLPEAARAYILEKATKKFQARDLGSQTLDAFTQADIADAMVVLAEYDLDTDRHNFLTGSQSVQGIWARNDSAPVRFGGDG